MAEWVLVPIKPTYGMVKALFKVANPLPGESYEDTLNRQIAAAIAARPDPLADEALAVSIAKLLSAREGLGWEYCAQSQWIGDAKAVIELLSGNRHER